jgi:hypothetical protein
MSDAVHDVIFSRPRDHVYAILDGASVEGLLDALEDHAWDHCCLFSGELHPDLRRAAPYLVRLKRGEQFTRWVLGEGWGRNWGVFASVGPFADFRYVRKHFRTFLMVRDPRGAPLYFRYYDPRVLRVYLPTCNEEEMEAVFGPVAFFAMEDADEGQLVRIWRDRDAPRTERIELAPASV